MNKDRKIGLPSLDKAKELTKQFKRPLGYNVLLINSVAPSVTEGGVMISEGMQKQHQEALNRQGMLVVSSPFAEDSDSNNVNKVVAGEKVMYGINAQASLLTVITSEDLIEDLDLEEGAEILPTMYQKYVVMIMDTNSLVAVVE